MDYFKNHLAKDVREEKRFQIEKTFSGINQYKCVQIIQAGQEFSYSLNHIKKRFPHGYYLFKSTHWSSDEAECARFYNTNEHALNCVADCFEIDRQSIIRAARIYDRFYERTTGAMTLDEKKLLLSVLLNDI